MSFISFPFIILFLFAMACRIWIGPTKTEKPYLAALLVLSLIFYGSFIPQYLLLLLFTTLVDYYAGNQIAGTDSHPRKKAFLVLSLVSNLGLLAFFKYSEFALDNLRALCALLGLNGSWVPQAALALPIGISFFTFQSMSYTIDIYRGQIKPVNSYWRFLLFVSFFTHLVSGPIVRANELLYQFDRKRRLRWMVSLQGLYLMILGFFLKMVVADNLADYVNRYWERGGANGMPAAVPLSLAVMFSCQIFADFAGYTSIATGAAYLLGFKLPMNFNSPYIASSFREFWTRWHITLSRWIRDYLYIPLGGNKGSGWRPYWILMVTMVLAGFWHGAAFTFLIWGALHGFFLGLERMAGMNGKDKGHSGVIVFFWSLLTQAVVLIGWIFFRAKSVTEAFHFIRNLSNVTYGWNTLGQITPAFFFILPVLLTHLRSYCVESGWMKSPGIREKGFWAAFMLYFIFTLYGKNNAFIYFQF